MPLKHNTAEKLEPSNGRTIVQTVLVILALTLLINTAAVAYLSRYTSNSTYWLLQTKWRSLMSGPALDWLILGDSSGNQGLDAGLFSREMGPAYNYCTFGDALLRNDADMLRAYIQRHGAPKGVLLVHTYDIWYRAANPQVVAHAPVPLCRLADYWADIPRKDQFLTKLLLDRWLPLWSQPSSLRAMVTHPLRLFAPRKELDDHGMELQYNPDPAHLKKDAADHLVFTASNTFTVSQVNRASVAEICRLADADHFDVYFAMCPIYEGVTEAPQFRAYYGEVLDYLNGVESANPRFHLLGPFPIPESAERMQSVDHVIHAAAEDFTHSMILRIRAAQAGGVTREG